MTHSPENSPPIILELGHENSEPIYEIRHTGIRDAKIAVTVAAQERDSDPKRRPSR